MIDEPTVEPHEQAPLLQDDVARCVHCGFCLQACPTYLELGMETDSPRGRIALVDAMISGRAEATPSLVGHLDLCLQCRACETACPSSVPFGRIMEAGRAHVMETRPPRAWRMRALALREILPHRRRLGALMTAMRLYGRSPLRASVRGLLRRIAPSLAAAEIAMPDVPQTPFRLPPQPPGLTRSVALLSGCVMPHLYPRTHAATVRVLNALGYRVVAPEEQTCCGALSMHAGDRQFARDLARTNIDAFLTAGVEAVIVNSAGCGSTMKEYAELLASDATYRDRARRLVEITKDVLEFVADHDLPPLSELPKTVTYQDSCHLVHAQRVARAPRDLMQRIPGLELCEMAAPDRCCGSAGIYSIVQQSMSRRLLDNKMDDIAKTGAATIATANPGCMMQLQTGVRLRGMRCDVVHVIELIDEALAGTVAKTSD
jgi:Fe-S oxidoreductase